MIVAYLWVIGVPLTLIALLLYIASILRGLREDVYNGMMSQSEEAHILRETLRSLMQNIMHEWRQREDLRNLHNAENNPTRPPSTL